jgi:hypothetical protein
VPGRVVAIAGASGCWRRLPVRRTMALAKSGIRSTGFTVPDGKVLKVHGDRNGGERT